jgi:hypothetical protein
VIDELMGHKKETLALSMYSGVMRMADLRKAVDALLKVIEPSVLGALGATQVREPAAA